MDRSDVVITGLFDKKAVFQVIGCLIQNPTLLDNYALTLEDFDGEEFHQIIFACIFNLYNQGVNVIDSFAIDSFISGYEKQYKIFIDNNGLEYINDASVMSEIENFDYNFNRLKKFSLLRYYESQAFDTRGIYNPMEFEPSKQEKEQRKFDEISIVDIISAVEVRFVIEPKSRFSLQIRNNGQLAGIGMLELINKFREEPEIGFPMQSKFMNTLLRGGRFKTFYLRSGGTGSGKTRLSIADTCYNAVPWFYDIDKEQWIYTGFCNPSLIISTELSIEEVQTIVAAFISGVEEDHIIDNTYTDGEYERVIKATEYIKSSPLYIEHMPDFDTDDIVNLIKRYHREKDVQLVNFDYLHTSMKLMAQISSVAKGMRIREDQVLFMFSDKLKACSTELNIHVDSATQLNDGYKDAKEKDQSILRGAKSLADRIDAGYIALVPSRSELEAVKPILSKGFYPTPNMIYHLYKCRRGKITRVKVWLHVNLGNCRVEDLFVTTFDNELVPVDKLTIESASKIIEDLSMDEKEYKATKEEQEEAVRSFLSF